MVAKDGSGARGVMVMPPSRRLLRRALRIWQNLCCLWN